MIQQWFAALGQAVSGSPALALGAAFVWGVLSVVLSPCHLASIPLIVGFIDLQGRVSARRALAIASVFAFGILLTIALIGVLTAAAGRMLGGVGAWGNYLVAGLFFVVGLHLAGVIPLPWTGPGQVGLRRKGMLAALILGLVFGVALGPCTFAFMAPVLGAALKVAGTDPARGALLLLAYGFGHCAVIALAGGSTGLVQRYLNWNERSRGTTRLRAACGVLLMIGGVYLVYVTP